MKKIVYSVMSVMLLWTFTACHPSASAGEKQMSRPKHVIVVGFDGLSAYCLNHGAKMPFLRKMMKEGAYTLENRSILPSSSACNWASMFMGAGPELHGFNAWDSREPAFPSRVLGKSGLFPNIFGLYREKAPDAEIGYIYEWIGMKFLVDTLAMNTCMHAEISEAFPEGAIAPAVKYIREKKPALLAVAFDNPDGTGHRYGWNSPEYLAMVEHQDSCIARIVEAVEEAGMMDETVIIVCSDHGGLERGHGGTSMNEMQTPIVFYGKGVKKGHQITESTMVYDIAGTLAWLLNVPQPQVWIARPITYAFE